MIIAIDPDTQQHACAMGELRGGQPYCARVWTIHRMGKKGAMHRDYLEGLLDIIQIAKDNNATIICEDAYAGKNLITYKRLIEARHEITHRAWEYGAKTLPHVQPSVWMAGLGISPRMGREQIIAAYEFHAQRWATALGWTHQLSEHESAAMGILWWSMTTAGKRQHPRGGKE